MALYVRKSVNGCDDNRDLMMVFGDPDDGRCEGALERLWDAYLEGHYGDLLGQIRDYLEVLDFLGATAAQQEWASNVGETIQEFRSVLSATDTALNSLGPEPDGVERTVTLGERLGPGVVVAYIDDTPLPGVAGEHARLTVYAM